MAIAGDTQSTDLPVLSAYQSTIGGRQDAFVACFTTAGVLTRSTYFGGAGDDAGRALALLSGTSFALAGSTDSPNLPVASPLQAALRGSQDGYIAKFTNSSLNFATYLGGSGGGIASPESIEALATDSTGNFYLGGITPSSDFPTANALFPNYRGGETDGFLVKLAPAGNQLLVSTFIGGRGRDDVAAIGLAPDGAVSVAGSTTSADLALLQPLITSYRGGIDGFVLKLESTLTTLSFGTYLGGTSADAVASVVFTPAGDLWIAGQSGSLDFPTVSPVQVAAGSSLRFFVSRIAFQPKPRPETVTPPAASGLAQAFTFQFSHPIDAAQVTGLQVIFANGWDPSLACFIQYLPASNQLSLAADSGTVWNSMTLGSAASAQNSQCVLKAATSSFSKSGKNFTFTIDLTFQPAFKGVREIWATAWDASASSGGVELGTYSVIGSQPPSVVSVSPANATGAGAVFAVTLSDPNGSRDITGVQVVVNNVWDGNHACFLYYLRDAASVALADDLLSVWTPVRLGSADTAQNSQCVLAGMGSSVTESGNVLTLSLSLSFKPGFAGQRYVFVSAWDRDGLTTGAVQSASYLVGASANQAPAPLSLTPATATGRGDLFSLTVNDADGVTDISGIQILINTAFNSFGACLVYHQRGSGTVALANDSLTLWNVVRLGTADTAENNQCSIAGAQSSVITSGTSLTLNLGVAFKSAINGVQRFYVSVWDQSNSSSGPVEMGRYTVNDPPALISASPNAGAGTSDRFQIKFSDPNGGTDIQAAFLLFNKVESASGGCLVYYERGYTRLYLLDDSGSTLTGVTPGSSETIDNSQCTLKGANSSFTISGTGLTIQADLTFKPAAAGAQTIYAAAVDTAGAILSLRKTGIYSVSGTVAPQ